MQVQKLLWMNHANLSLKELIIPPRTGIEERHCQFFKFTHGWSHFHKKWDDSAYRKHNADGGGRGGEGRGDRRRMASSGTQSEILWKDNPNMISTRMLCQLSFIWLTACYFPFATPTWRSSGWTQSESGGGTGDINSRAALSHYQP